MILVQFFVFENQSSNDYLNQNKHIQSYYLGIVKAEKFKILCKLDSRSFQKKSRIFNLN